jgi:hypothetical protein
MNEPQQYADMRVREFKKRLSNAIVREIEDFSPHDFQNETLEFRIMRARYTRLLTILEEHGIAIHSS